MRSCWGAAAAVVAAGMLAGCGGGGSATAAKTVTRTVKATATVTITASAQAGTTAASQSTSKPLRVGKTANFQGSKVTVLRVAEEHAATHGLIAADQRFIGVKVRVCLAEDGNVGYSPWRVIGSDGGEYESLDVFPSPTDWPHPAYPYDTPDDPQRKAGSCMTGWMMFGVNKSVKAARVSYRIPTGTAEWKAS